MSEAEIEGFKMFLERLSEHEMGTCMDMVPCPGFNIDVEYKIDVEDE